MTQQELTICLHQYTPWEALHLQHLGNFQDIEDMDLALDIPMSDGEKNVGLHLSRTPDQADNTYSEPLFFSDPSEQDIFIVQHDRYTPPLLHKHGFFELVYVYEGEFVQQIEAKKLLMHTGDFCLIPPGVNHSLDVCNYSIVLNILITESKFKNIIFNELKADNLISSFFIGNVYSENVNDFIVFHTNGDRRIQELILDMCLEQINAEDYHRYMINADMLKLLGLLLRSYEKTCDVPQIRRKKDSENFSILQYIEQNYRTVTLNDLARRFHYSTQHMSQRIKQITGMPFTDYILQKRMKTAADLLTNTNVKVKAICENTGYQSQEHFIRTFRKYYGVTPGVYRTMHQKV